MPLAERRRWALVAAALLLLPVAIALLALPAAPHAGHECPFEKECVACRWAADAVSELAVPAVQGSVPRPLGLASPTSGSTAVDPVRLATSTRGPPLS